MTRYLLTGLVFGAAFSLLELSLPFGIDAQQATRRGETPGQSAAISDKELRAFAKSYIEFHKLRAEYESALGKAHDLEARGKIEQEAVAKFSKKLRQQGLTMEGYARIFQTVNADEQIREKALKLIEEERKKA